jgi:cell wall-associated NlpC family hydrolase
MKKKLTPIALFIILLSSFLYTSCDKDEPNNPVAIGDTDQTNLPDYLSEENNAYIESISVPASPSDKLLFDTYTGRKIDVINNKDCLAYKIVLTANDLCLLKDGVKPDCHVEAEPHHCGIAYSFGQRDYTVRAIPPYWPVDKKGNINIDKNKNPEITKEQKKSLELHRKDAVFGLDCSGFVINIFETNGIILSADTRTENFYENLKTAMKSNKNTYVAENKKKISGTDLKNGDLILWKSHMGVIAMDGVSIKVCQANGQPFPKDEEDQKKNYGKGRGVHEFSLNTMLSKGYPWGIEYSIIRITEPWILEKSKIDNGDLQIGQLGKQLEKPIKVTILDNNKKPMKEIKVYFKANNGGSVSQEEVITDADGTASTKWTLGSVDESQTITVTAYKSKTPGGTKLSNSPIVFTANVNSSNSSIVGTWKMSAAIYEGVDVFNLGEGNSQLGNNGDYILGYDNCDKDDLITFDNNNTVIADDGIIKCSASDPQTYTGTYTFNDTKTQITLVMNGDTVVYEILTLNATTLKVKYNGGVSTDTYIKQ